MGDLELFLIGLTVVGLSLTIKVVRDGLREIAECRQDFLDSVSSTAECEARTVEIEEGARELDEAVQGLRREVQILEAKERELASTVKSKREAEEQKSTTKFRVDLGR